MTTLMEFLQVHHPAWLEEYVQDMIGRPIRSPGDRRPTVEELAAFLDETQRAGMNPAAQADHLRQHYPDCVREEDTE